MSTTRYVCPVHDKHFDTKDEDYNGIGCHKDCSLYTAPAAPEAPKENEPAAPAAPEAPKENEPAEV